MIRVTALVATAILSGAFVGASPLQDRCDAILQDGVFEHQSFKLSKSDYWVLRTAVETSETLDQARDQSAGLTIPFEGVPINGSYSDSSWSKWKREFLKLTYSEAQSSLAIAWSSKTVKVEIVAAWSECMRARESERGLKLRSESFSDPRLLTIHFEYIPHAADAPQFIDIAFEGNETADGIPAILFKKVLGVGAIRNPVTAIFNPVVDNGVEAKRVSAKADLTPSSIECSRQVLVDDDGRRYLPECRLTVVGSTYRPLRLPRLYLDEIRSKLSVSIDSFEQHHSSHIAALELSRDAQGNELLGDLGRVKDPQKGAKYDFGKGFESLDGPMYLCISAVSAQHTAGANRSRPLRVQPGTQYLTFEHVRENRSDGSIGVTFLSEVAVKVEFTPRERDFGQELKEGYAAR